MDLGPCGACPAGWLPAGACRRALGCVVVAAGVGEQVGPVLFRPGVLGTGDQKFAWLGELVGVPPGVHHSLSQDEVAVAGFPYPRADADVHLRVDRGSLAHGLLCWPLGRGNQVLRHGAAPAGYRVGVSACSSGSSAHSSTTITMAGSSGVGSHTRFPSAAIRAARWSSRATVSRKRPVACSG